MGSDHHPENPRSMSWDRHAKDGSTRLLCDATGLFVCEDNTSKDRFRDVQYARIMATV